MARCTWALFLAAKAELLPAAPDLVACFHLLLAVVHSVAVHAAASAEWLSQSGIVRCAEVVIGRALHGLLVCECRSTQPLATFT